MNNLSTTRRSAFAALAAGAFALASLGFAGIAQARDDISFSFGVGVPGVQLGVSNAYPIYVHQRPVYVQPQPIYVQPRPVYVQPQPVYIQSRPFYVQPAPVYVRPRPIYYNAPPVYVVPEPIYQGRRHGRHRGWDNRHNGHDGYDGYRGNTGYYGQQPQRDHGGRMQGYGSVYYSR